MTDQRGRLAAALADRYRIEGDLGAGGMATVYLAHDLRHERKVAIKVLRPELAAVIGAERFLAEIKTTANLQHPHILPLFDSGEVDGTVFYAMPFVEGESLRDRLNRVRQLPIPEALRIAGEVADALDYAHRHGVIHRDIKPENVLLHDDRAQVADFGIALAATNSEAGSRMTETGMSLGTPQYMSPEQAMGERELDARTDVYALGCVLYEMLAGEPPFTGPTPQAVVARMMTEDPRALTSQRKTISPAVEGMVFTALARLPADRYATAAEFAAELRHPGGGRGATRTAIRAAVAPGPRRWFPAAVMVIATLTAGVLLGRLTGPDGGTPAGVVRATISLGAEAAIRPIPNHRLAISPDGRRIAFVGGSGQEVVLWIRELDGAEARPLPDTEGAFAPFFSPDGNSVGFFTVASSARPNLRVVPVTGGVVRTVVADSASGFGADWADDGNIYFSHANLGLARVPAGGGTVVQVSLPDSMTGVSEHDFPDVLPGSRHALAILWRGSIGSNRVALVDLSSGAVTELGSGTYARYLPPGFLIIGDAAGTLLAARFDSRSGTTTGAPTPMVRLVQRDGTNGSIQFAVSAAGDLVYQEGQEGGGGLSWVARDGSETPVDTSMNGIFSSMSISPDGRSIAVSNTEAGTEAVWIKQLPAGAFTRLSGDVLDANRPVWTPDGRSVAFMGRKEGTRRIALVRRSDGSDQTRPVVPGDPDLDEVQFSPDGRYVLMRSRGGGPGSRYLMISEPSVDSVPRVLLRAAADHYAMVLSPNGRWMAYVSEESGSPEVYVRPFPNVDSARVAVSVGGGTEPIWARDGTELFYRRRAGEVVAVPVRAGASFSHDPPVTLFTTHRLSAGQYYRAWDIHPDGRFLMSRTGGQEAAELSLVLNWVAELERLDGGQPQAR